MKRLLTTQLSRSTTVAPQRGGTLSPGAAWNGFVLPAVPSADWPASLAFEHGIDRLVRDALATGRSMQEITGSIAALAQSLALSVSETELTRRVHAQVLANT